MCCKNDDKNIYDKYSNTLVKTITNDTISIIGKWRKLMWLVGSSKINKPGFIKTKRQGNNGRNR